MSELTDKQYLLLSQFAYVKATTDSDKFQIYVDAGWTLKDIIGEVGVVTDLTILGSPEGKIIENNGCITTEEFVEILEVIAEDETLGNLKLKDYQDENNKGGFVAYVLSDRLFVSNLDKINCRENKKKKAGTYDLHKLKFRIA